ncbi:MAG: hypothetical protein FDX18_05085 [Chlorobium sp.]|nr:MAG: hypothetical protein FDX18_05085 [Chlorobium sp.]
MKKPIRFLLIASTALMICGNSQCRIIGKSFASFSNNLFEPKLTRNYDGSDKVKYTERYRECSVINFSKSITQDTTSAVKYSDQATTITGAIIDYLKAAQVAVLSLLGNG